MLYSSIAKITAVALGCALLTQAAVAQDPSTAPIKIVIGFPAGGALDSMSRAMAEKLRTDWGRTVIVDNKPGASTHIALVAVKRRRRMATPS